MTEKSTATHDQPVEVARCIACPMEVRDLYATVHNYLMALQHSSPERVQRKLAEMRFSANRMEAIVEAHFDQGHHRAQR